MALATEMAAGRPDTRERILTAARELIVAHHSSALSVATIAQAAGVSHRTVYRYFPTKEALIEAVAHRPVAPGAAVPLVESWAEAPGALRVGWRLLGQHLDVLRGERMIPAGAELRRARYAAGRKAVEAVLRDAGVPEGQTLESLTEAVLLLISTSSLLELVDRHGLDVDRSIDVVLDAIKRLVASATQGTT